MGSTLERLPPGTLLKESQIVNYDGKKRPRHIGLLPVSRSSWLKFIKEGKAPPGRQRNPELCNSPRLWTIEEVMAVREAIDKGEIML